MNTHRIQKVAVLGSGVMGTGIACHLANVGLDVLLLDIVPFDLSDADKKNPAKRNSIVNGSMKKALKSKPAALYTKGFASRITTGNFDDHFDKVADADWIIEVIVERVDIKQQMFERIENIRKAGSLVTSNTSSIPIGLLCEGRSDDFKSHFCGTHFFNPARYMPLLEIIPHAGTAQSVTDFFMHWADTVLGKTTVLCKDTPAFIGNRIGVMSGIKMVQLTVKHDMRLEEVDAITGPLIGRPNTATYRLQDLVGIDTSDKVTKFVKSAVKDDEFLDQLGDGAEPPFMKFVVENKFFGNKSGKGFYEKTSERDEKGKRIVNVLNTKTLEYEPSIRPKLAVIKEAKAIELFDKRMATLLEGDDRENEFLREYFSALLSYSGCRVPEISDEFYSVDDAMRTGYMWDYGPFQYWDIIGIEKGLELIKKYGNRVPSWVTDLVNNGIQSFYRSHKGRPQYYSLQSKKYENIPGTENFVILDNIRDKTPIIKNSECTVHDIGDGVMCLEFRSKSNAIGEGIGKGLHEAIQKAEEEGWNGVVIGNNAKNFTVGANLMNIGMVAMQKDFKKLDEMVHQFQQLTMLLRTSKVPTCVATQGYVFGGGCEMSMHANAGIYAAESYIGLVEVGVGLLPGGGGTKEMALRAGDTYYQGDTQIPMLIEHFKPVATATVATSAYEAFDHFLLDPSKDEVCVKTQNNIGLAKAKVLELAKDFVAPVPREDVRVLGRTGLSALYSAINEFKLGGYMSDYDVEVARKVAYVIAGGDLTSQQMVSEQYLLDIEREGFLSLLGNQKTLDRIQYMLMNNKPLRN